MPGHSHTKTPRQSSSGRRGPQTSGSDAKSRESTRPLTQVTKDRHRGPKHQRARGALGHREHKTQPIQRTDLPPHQGAQPKTLPTGNLPPSSRRASLTPTPGTNKGPARETHSRQPPTRPTGSSTERANPPHQRGHPKEVEVPRKRGKHVPTRLPPRLDFRETQCSRARTRIRTTWTRTPPGSELT